jgi:predicted RNA-binding Zn-ribbon protein involved in translation (DUF1610 family)
MDDPELHFYPASGNEAAAGAPAGFPLARFLPPLQPGMAAAWLAKNVSPGSWLLDPLGASPALTLEAAQAGYRVLVASNNPILSFITETLARAPRSPDFQSAIAELSMVKRGEERLQHHLQSLYQTACAACGEPVQPQAFLWRKDESEPFARLYDCPKCGQSGEHPVAQADLDRLKAMGGDKLQRARALQRVTLDQDAHRADVEEALENYLPRPLYILFTLANKLEGLGLPPERTRLLQALLISTFDQGSTLWPWPGGRSRPKQLTVPPQFRENNLWLAMEEAVKEWAHQPGPIPVTRWPDLPPEGAGGGGGICLFRGRVKALMPLPETIRPGAILTVFPRPNQAFWTLSALWSGWLWGAEAALPLLNVLDRRRYDWNWHTTAIHSALAAVAATVAPETPFFGLLPELAPGFLSAVVTAASAAGFRLEGLASRSEEEFAQGLWRPDIAARERTPERAEAALPDPAEMESAARATIQADLLARNEPAPYLTEYAAGLAGMARSGAIPRWLGNIPSDLLNRVQAALARTFADRSLLKLYGGPADEERGLWWLAKAPSETAGGEQPGGLPLADRVEMEVVRFMQRQPNFAFEELDRRICAQFPGLLTPPADLVRACVESYGETIPGHAGDGPQSSWRMRENENSAARKADLQQVRASLARTGQQLGFTVKEQDHALIWEADGAPAWRFYAMASSILSRYVLTALPSGGQRVLLIPGSRAHLVRFKLRRDPRLAEALGDAETPNMLFPPWRIIKFRHLREIASRVDLSLTTWELLLDEDPLTDEATQMLLFGEV